MAKRKIITIDEKKCNGCGVCIPNCPEGAIQIIDKKARLISDLFCDGLGACIGHCPQGAIRVVEREAAAYDETKVMANIVKQGKNVIIAHLKHLKEHGEQGYLKDAVTYLKKKKIDIQTEDIFEKQEAGHFQGCPGSRLMDFKDKSLARPHAGDAEVSLASALRQWPVQLMLVPPHAPFLENADVLIAADCVPFAYADFHQKLLKGKALLVGCPKLDDLSVYQEKITQMLKSHTIKSVTYAHMEVPCCSGLIRAIEQAIAGSGKAIPFEDVTISIKGEKIEG